MATRSPMRAVKRFCESCAPGGARCTSTLCPLAATLGGATDDEIRRAIRTTCLQCVENTEEVAACTGILLFEAEHCPLHPYRLGTTPTKEK